MRKSIGNLLFAALLVSGLSANVSAQTTPRTGIKGGFNASTMNSGLAEQKERYSFHAGVFTQIPLGEYFAIQPELLYSGKGVSGTTAVLGSSNRSTFRLDYVELPLLATFKLGNSVDLNVGPYAAYLVNSKFTSDGDFGSISNTINRDNFNKLDYGLAGGLNIYFGRALLGLRYGQGLNQVANSGNARLVLGDAKNATGQVSLGVTF